ESATRTRGPGIPYPSARTSRRSASTTSTSRSGWRGNSPHGKTRRPRDDWLKGHGARRAEPRVRWIVRPARSANLAGEPPGRAELRSHRGRGIRGREVHLEPGHLIRLQNPPGHEEQASEEPPARRDSDPGER